MGKKKKVYIVTEPTHLRGIYHSWPECDAVVKGVKGAKYQGVDGMEKAKVLLDAGIALPPGVHAFTDGNAQGGVGLVMVDQGESSCVILEEISAHVVEVFADTGIPGLRTARDVGAALGRMHNILAELAALHLALAKARDGLPMTIVYDCAGIGAWMQGRWKKKDPVVNGVVGACEQIVAERGLAVTYRHQRGHQSSWAARDDYAKWNAVADKLATEGSSVGVGPKLRPDPTQEPGYWD